MLKIEYDKPLAALTTFHLRANAEAWVEVASLEDIRDALSVAKGRGWQTGGFMSLTRLLRNGSRSLLLS